MKVIFTTNLDKYKNGYFPKNLSVVPRKGEMVSVNQEHIFFFKDNMLPTRLEVVQVTYFENQVVCELWYNQTDKKIAELAGAKTLN
jgi:hypothetical protein